MVAIGLSVPYAILPGSSIQGDTPDFNDDENGTNTAHRGIFTVSDNKFYEWKYMLKGHPDSWCVGSSLDFLILLDTNGFPFLLNPTSSSCIYFPRFPHSFFSSYSLFLDDHVLRKSFVSKAVLMSYTSASFPSHTPQYILVLIFSCARKLAYCQHNKWVEFFDAKSSYCDIIIHNNNLFALADNSWLEGWEFCDNGPVKVLDVRPSMEIDDEEDREFPWDTFSTQSYLLMLEKDFMLVKRFIGNYVTTDGEVVYEGHDDDALCPYRTKYFVVYKLEIGEVQWKKKRSLNDNVLFVGANESASVPAQALHGCETDSIYFTDDRWEEMNLDSLYGGHDWGVFSLKNQCVNSLNPYAHKMNPPPIWVVPTFL
ncbi:hypothetical protein RJT34_31194 [Clitoria ternatea]|uniref:KIB1-4 beta-propeller domain-containing protein n=1 Tax=Clitoria ternatea TaxID=43366 RepID=A0AAN9EUL0_CLITE